MVESETFQKVRSMVGRILDGHEAKQPQVHKRLAHLLLQLKATSLPEGLQPIYKLLHPP